MDTTADKVKALIAPYAEREELDSQELTEIAGYLLQEEGVDHVVMTGHLYLKDSDEYPHYWIELDTGHIVDFRCPATDEGVFLSEPYGTYAGDEATDVMINKVRFRTLTEK
jgi:hypothetical protein